MDFEYLDSESEVLLKDLIDGSKDPKHTIRGSAIDHLVKQGYVDGKNVTTLSDVGPCYMVFGVLQKGKSYFEMKAKYEKEQRKLSHREWKIAIVSALIGATVGLIPSIISWIKQ